MTVFQSKCLWNSSLLGKNNHRSPYKKGAIELERLDNKAKASGACQLVVKDLKEESVSEYIYPCLHAGAVYERKYLLGTSMAMPVIAKAMVDVAKEVGADSLARGCTGKGSL
ncbi:hypothetical protein BDA96_09G166700 [Sorghum bicolor]|uniref:Arginosuccinate synthase-like N-terminal domain-containing protein n=2 Tax=Sorghum bicolor TaxID=4558 RepID=A0A921QDH8_SORBI|nr:argininosuccinate synthase, chloroplastic isoform X2 [Sorghum bicolor]EES19624.2 hypothetical protein SORBI_3009G158800 [Sorghum bicolor]KAG0518330.1 hypothetical protein BDA96_09G166700 [Sorghum bicolor]KAG0518331.1 hypothetical protein BDA96_09G166700 [Sorghum bicolor]|eukprot:XP_021302511.1 argininosuccinate synthase, chloroplastic isoform X2 [Sorghum bicolor]